MTYDPCVPQRLASRPRRRLRISLTPLIDVVFILLIFFMLASSFLDWRSIRLTSAPAGFGASGVEGALLLDLTADGPRLSGVALSDEALRDQLAGRIERDPEQRVLVRPRPDVEMQRMVDLLDTVAAAGVRNIALMGDAP
ncbi:MAG: biopolymer transporter ExbD [Pseudomonadota bacterium]